MSELDQFLETPNEQADVVDTTTTEQEAGAEAKQQTDAAEGKVENNAETTAAVEDESTADTKDEPWTKAAYQDEKRKRQERDDRIAQLEKELEATKTPKQEVEDPDMFADPEGFKKSIKGSIDQEVFKARVEIGREIMLDKHADYEAMELKFTEMAKTEPALITKMRASANPAKFAYETAAKQKALDEIGDPIAYRDKLKAEILAELKGADTKEEDVKPEVKHTPSLATATAAKSNKDFHDPGLEELFAR